MTNLSDQMSAVALSKTASSDQSYLDLERIKQKDTEFQELKSKVKRLELIMEISKQFNSTLDVNKLMQTILDRIAEVLNAEASSFWMKDKQTNENVCHVSVGPVKDKILGMRLKAGTGIVGWVIENKEKTVVFDASNDERFHNKIDEETSFITKSMLCVPLIVDNECLAAISLINKKTTDGQFNQQDLEMLELLAMNGAIAIKNAQLYQSKRRIKELNAILNISKEITSTLDLDRVLLTVVNLGSEVIHFKRAVIALLDSSNIVLAAESNTPQPDLQSSANKQMHAIMNYVMDSGRPLNITNYNRNHPPGGIPQMVLNYMNEFNLLCLSVIVLADSEGKLGVISMEGTYTSLVVEDSAYVINLLINHATVAIRNAQLYRNVPVTRMGGKFRSILKAEKHFWQKAVLAVSAAVTALIICVTLPVPANVIADLEIIPEHTTQVTSMADGVVKKVTFHEGEQVEKGRPLVYLDPSLLELEKKKVTQDSHIVKSDLRRLESEGRPYEVRLKRLELEKLENQLDFLDQHISFASVLSPAGGRILTQKPEELVDKQVIKGEVLAAIAVDDKKSGKIILDDEDVLNVSPGNQISLTLQALPDILIKGKLDYVSHSKEASKNELEITGYTGYFSSNQLNEIPAVRYGMTGKAKIHTGRKTLYQLYLKPLIARSVTRFKMVVFD